MRINSACTGWTKKSLAAVIMIFTSGTAFSKDHGLNRNNAAATQEFLSDLKSLAQKSAYPVVSGVANLQTDFVDQLEVLTSQETHAKQLRLITAQYQDQGQNPELNIENFAQLPLISQAALPGLQRRLKQAPLEIPGLSAPVQLQTKKTARQILASRLADLSFHERTLLLSAVLFDTRYDFADQRTLIELLMTQFQLQGSDFGPLWPQMTDEGHLLFYVPDPSEWRLIMREVGDPSEVDALGYTVHDPATHRSLVLLNGELLFNLADSLKVLVHELSHVLQHRFGEAHGFDFYKTPMHQGLGVLLMEGMANDGAYRLFADLSERLSSAGVPFSGFDWFSAKLWSDLWGQNPSILAPRRAGALFSRLLYSATTGFNTPANQNSPGIQALLEAYFQQRGLDHILWAAQMAVKPFSAPARFLAIDHGLRSAEDQDSYLSNSFALVNSRVNNWLIDRWRDFPLVEKVICNMVNCKSADNASLSKAMMKLIADESILLLIELSRHQQDLKSQWQKMTGQVLTDELMVTPFAQWPKDKRDQWINLLVLKFPLFHQDGALSFLQSLLTPKGFKWARNPSDTVSIVSCLSSEVSSCSTSAGIEADKALGWKTVVQIRLDGHSDPQILQSLWHELTHHLQSEIFFSLNGNLDFKEGPAFPMVSEGLAMWSALGVPFLLRDIAKDPLSAEFFTWMGWRELCRESPNQHAAILWQSLFRYLPQAAWQGIVIDGTAKMPNLTVKALRDRIQAAF